MEKTEALTILMENPVHESMEIRHEVNQLLAALSFPNRRIGSGDK